MHLKSGYHWVCVFWSKMWKIIAHLKVMCSLCYSYQYKITVHCIYLFKFKMDKIIELQFIWSQKNKDTYQKLNLLPTILRNGKDYEERSGNISIIRVKFIIFFTATTLYLNILKQQTNPHMCVLQVFSKVFMDLSLLRIKVSQRYFK